MQPIPYSLSNDVLTVTVEGSPKFVRKGASEFEALRAALIAEDWDTAHSLLKPGGGVAHYLAAHNTVAGIAQFQLRDGQLYFNDERVHPNVASRIDRMAASGEDPTPVIRFYERLQQNPSKRSVDQLFDFLQHLGLPFEADGTFLAYKGVNDDLSDKYTGRIFNTPGAVIKINRNLVSDDPRTPCHEGLHVGAHAYASTFASTTIAVRVDPKNVVCVPYDSSSQKMRVCEYEVIGLHSGELMPNNTIPAADVPAKSTAANLAPCANCGIQTHAVENFCHGCKQVVCNDCDQDHDRAMGPHELSDHLTLDSPAADSRKGEIDPEYENVAETVDAVTVANEPAVEAFTGEQLDQAVTEHAHEAEQAKKFRQFKKLTTRQLLEQTLTDLREYALKLKIVGSGHIKGGKTALVPHIVKARSLANRKRLKVRGKKARK
jgi:hypothetical protein